MTYELNAHPASPWHPGDLSLFLDARIREDYIDVRYTLSGAIEQVLIPKPTERPSRRDELWSETCFELFLRQNGSTTPYLEFNFSPSGDFAVYLFSGYREGMTRPVTTWVPAISVDTGEGGLTLSTRIPTTVTGSLLGGHDGIEAGLCSVLKAHDGSYAFLAAHHPSEKPDFHHPESFLRF